MKRRNASRKLLLWGSGGFEFVHYEETARDLAFRLFSLADLFAVDYGCVAHILVEETAERSKTLKADFKTNIRHAQLFAAQQLFRLLNPPFDQILMRRFVKGLPEESQKVITREAGLFGDLVQTKRMVVTMVDEITRSPETLQRLEVGDISVDSLDHYAGGYIGGFGGNGFCIDAAMNSVIPVSTPP